MPPPASIDGTGAPGARDGLARPRSVVLPPGTDAAGFRLLNDWQRGFPLLPRPFAALGAQLGMAEDAVIAAYRRWADGGLVGRIGAVFAPHRLGASALAALAVPPARLAEAAERVSAEPGVNHNYEREHRFNLWFVITAADAQALSEAIAAIERDTGCPAIVLPLLEEYHIDLGFDLRDGAAPAKPGAPADAAAAGARSRQTRRPSSARDHSQPPAAHPLPAAQPSSPAPPFTPRPSSRPPLSARERRVLAALQDGLPLVAAPYAELGRRIGCSEAEVIDTIAAAQAGGLIRRFGVVLRHHELGIGANAMCVWDVPDERIGELGRHLAAEPLVTLCYRRPRALPHWRYNLFCMIHGSERSAVAAARDEIAARLGLDAWPHALLFSGRRFKQRGARYLPTNEETCHA